MADNDRQFSWRQGNIITLEAAKALDLLTSECDDQYFAVVASHDCDLSAAREKEPYVEVVIGNRIDKLGGDSFGKTARRLHIEYQSEAGPLAIELLAPSKRPIAKHELFITQPRQDIWLDGHGIAILQRWLASRYHRAAFPEAFEYRLRTANLPGKQTFLKRIEGVLADGGDHIRALLFDLDEGTEVERDGPEDVYRLGIIVLYESLRDEPAAAEAAGKAAEALEELFEAAFHSQDSGWKNIRLMYCDPASDSAITVAQREMLKQWRLEHMSLQKDPPQPMITL
ncbi:MAG: hypothetical protein IPN92_02080 [Chromatiaceae bacterium]|nr:hypothetical protein [Chromatiaceae bacterium]